MYDFIDSRRYMFRFFFILINASLSRTTRKFLKMHKTEPTYFVFG